MISVEKVLLISSLEEYPNADYYLEPFWATAG